MKPINIKHIKAILFDSGDTLNSPVSGHWFIPPNFTSLFEHDLGKMKSETMQTAWAHAYGYLESHHAIDTEAQEYEQFQVFYTKLLTACEYSGDTEAITADLAHDTVYNDDRFHFFKDVFEVIPILHQHFLLGIVSDTWPSLERVFRARNLRHYFSTFVISSQLGVSKPHERMFLTAIEELLVSPNEALFIDDNLENVEGAVTLGLQAVLIDRNGNSVKQENVPHITDLYGLMDLLAIPDSSGKKNP